MTMPGVMSRFRITELSGVDRPAQAGATVAIIKRDDRQPITADEQAANSRAAATAFLNAAAQKRAAVTGVSFEKAYAAIVLEDPGMERLAKWAAGSSGNPAGGANIRDEAADAGVVAGERPAWQVNRAATERALQKLAAEDAKARGCTFEQSYSRLLMSSPRAQGFLK